MRKLSILGLMVVFAGVSLAVVNGTAPSEGEMAVTGASGSASATTSVSENRTMYRSTIQNTNNSCISGNQSQHLDFEGFQSEEENMTELSFNGLVQTSNPCVELDLEASEVSEKVYRLELVEKSTSEFCTGCIGAAKFRGTFSAPGDYSVKIVHDGEVLGTQKTPGFQEENITTEKTEPEEAIVWEGISSIFNWFNSFL